MAAERGSWTKTVGDLTNGDETLDYGVVDYREGRKVWFKTTIVTFPSEDDEVRVTPESVTERDY